MNGLDELLLARARQARSDPFMLRQVAAFDRRRGGKRVINRGDVPETISCTECIAENVTVDEWLALHHGDNPLPEITVPDYAPAARGRRPARQTPMIYR